ncbi:MAG: lipopolysaccharide heptosyltransferase family protein [Alphaproteobacteria bacterium]|nr:lipopolysaccharide heptosyltransferase family protein [Alphaproteobacteria bacterium]
MKPLVEDLIDECLTDLFIEDRPSALFLRWKPLGNREFDLIFDAQHNPIRTLVLRRTRHRIFVSGCWRYFFSNRRPPDSLIHPKLLTEKMLGLVAAATGRVIRPNHVWPLAAQWHEAASRSLPDGRRYIGLAPGAGKKGTGKCWPLDRYIELADKFRRDNFVPVFFLGREEFDWLDPLRQRVPGAQFPEWDREGSPEEINGPTFAMALAHRLDAAVANCSGIGHILAAGGVPLVSLFGPTRPSKYAPYTPDLKALRAQDFDPSGSIDAIPLETVHTAVMELISARPESQREEPALDVKAS